MQPSLAPAQISPVFTLQLHLDCRNMESTHYSEVKAVRRRDEGKKETNGAKDGWVGHWLGSSPSSGLVVVLATARLTLFTPLHTRRRTRTPPSPAHASFAAHIPRHSSLCESWNSSPCALFCLTLLSRVWPPPHRAGEEVKSGPRFSWCRAGGCSVAAFRRAVFLAK